MKRNLSNLTEYVESLGKGIVFSSYYLGLKRYRSLNASFGLKSLC